MKNIKSKNINKFFTLFLTKQPLLQELTDLRDCINVILNKKQSLE